MRPHVRVYSHCCDHLRLYREVFTDAGYKVDLSVPNVENIFYLEQNVPDLIVIDVTREEDPVDLFFLHWLQKHPTIPKLFCMDKYLQNTEIQQYLKEQKVPQLDKPFDIDVLIKRAGVCCEV